MSCIKRPYFRPVILDSYQHTEIERLLSTSKFALCFSRSVFGMAEYPKYRNHQLNDPTSQIRLLKLDEKSKPPKWVLVSPAQLEYQLVDGKPTSKLLVDGQVVEFAAVSYEWGDKTEIQELDIRRIEVVINDAFMTLVSKPQYLSIKVFLQ